VWGSWGGGRGAGGRGAGGRGVSENEQTTWRKRELGAMGDENGIGEYLTIKQGAAEMGHTGARALHGAVHGGRVKATRRTVGRRTVRVTTRAWLAEYLEDTARGDAGHPWRERF